jgi:hypothetical protein
MSETYPFHTRTVNGEIICGVAFVNGKFYEFVDPTTHSKRAKYACPRDGDTIEHDSIVNEIMAYGMLKAKLPADKWLEFCKEYVETEDRNVEQWEQQWNAMAA